jgi:isopentenyl-diphosphate delta-isomerase
MNNRKSDHLRICTEEKIEAGDTGFEKINLVHRALPEIDFDEIETGIEFLGKKLNYPLIIEAMTGGASKALKINRDLAFIAQEFGIGFGVGSQRMAIDDPGLVDTYVVRDVAPDILLIANLGAVQLNYGYGIEECERAVEMIDADALALHLNPLQEVIQPEGNKNFSNIIERINQIAKELKKPVIVKETGCGISYGTAKNLDVAAIDVSGHGGTSWSLVESYRSNGKTRDIGRAFSMWGIPTVDSIREVSGRNIPVIASGGIRGGIDAAKSLALGADCVGVALPVLRAWTMGGKDGLREFLDKFISELRISMFLTGSKNIGELKGKIRG